MTATPKDTFLPVCENVSRFTLIDDGTLDTVLRCDECGVELRFSDTSFYRDDDGDLDVNALIESEDMEHGHE